MPSSTVEDYLKHIYLLEQQNQPGAHVLLGELAKALGVTPGSATAMIKTLAQSGLVHYTPRSGATLSEAGEYLATMVLRRHRLIELLLVQVLGLDWSEVHHEAEVLEHAVSDKVLDKLDQLLGHPDTDPHGDPIPPAQGKRQPAHMISLVGAEIGVAVRVARITDQDSQFLQFLDQHGLVPGAVVTISSRSEAADAITLEFGDGQAVTLGAAAGAKILVQSVDPE
jgi:DtxR family Mn-dependent transcriptional regulator